ncbi:hypothetical protein HMN09_00000800 [Mycena chlorophos]|uniref:Uncharacterized protein n=1 Tax=Mycena chlorophos TaxID=658473 RepID=A0A8H6TV02_MYCCL|nr:hypothetical protein HMN09_00000800 [Mycena chlorophos]
MSLFPASSDAGQLLEVLIIFGLILILYILFAFLLLLLSKLRERLQRARQLDAECSWHGDASEDSDSDAPKKLSAVIWESRLNPVASGASAQPEPEELPVDVRIWVQYPNHTATTPFRAHSSPSAFDTEPETSEKKPRTFDCGA